MGQGAGVKRPPVAAGAHAPREGDGDAGAGGGAGSTDLDAVGKVRIRCQACTKVHAVPFGRTNLSCECGAQVWIALAHVAQQAAAQVDVHVRRGLRELEVILEEQADVCRRQWANLHEELLLVETLWDSQASAVAEGAPSQEANLRSPGGSAPGAEEAATARAVTREAFEAQDAAQVEEALGLARSAGLAAAPEALEAALRLLRQEEYLENMWRFIKRSLHERDRMDLELWCDEAEAQGMVVPEPVLLAKRALQSEEQAKLVELQYQAGVNRRAVEAHRAGDTKALQELAREARALGADPSPATAALSALHMDAGSRAAEGPHAAQPPECPRGIQEPSESAAGAGGAAAPEEAPRRPEPADAAGAPAPDAEPPGAAGAAAPGAAPAPDAAPAADASAKGHSKEVEEKVRALSASQLKAELAARGCGVDLTGVREKEELVWMLIAAWHMPKIGAARPASPPPPSAPPPPGEAGGAGRGSQRPQQGPPGGYGHAPFREGARADGRAPPPPRPPPPPRGGTGAWPPAYAALGDPQARARALACLGLSGSPSADELRKAYKRAALEWHPDRRQNHDRAEEAKVMFQRVRAAFDLLQAEL